MSNKLKSFKNLIAMSALAAATSFGNTAKAETNMGEIEDVKETPRGTLVIKKTADAKIGDVPTPWMFGRPDGQSAFANHFTTNATNATANVVIDETDGTVYASTGKGATTLDGEPITNIVNEYYKDYTNACNQAINDSGADPQYFDYPEAQDEETYRYTPNVTTDFIQSLSKNSDVGNLPSFKKVHIQNVVRGYLGLDPLDVDTEESQSSYVNLAHYIDQLIMEQAIPTIRHLQDMKSELTKAVSEPEVFNSISANFVKKITENTTKIIQFPLSKDGIPGTTGKEIVLPRFNNLLAAKNGSLYTITPNGDNATFTTFTPSGETYTATSLECGNFGEYKDSYFDGKYIYALGSKGGFIANTEENKIEETFNSPANATKIIGKDGIAYFGTEDGKVKRSSDNVTYPNGQNDPKLSAPITGLSFKKLSPNWYVNDTNTFVLAVCAAGSENKGYVELRPSDFAYYGLTHSEQNYPPKGTIKVICNPKDDKKLLYVTRDRIGKFNQYGE